MPRKKPFFISDLRATNSRWLASFAVASLLQVCSVGAQGTAGVYVDEYGDGPGMHSCQVSSIGAPVTLSCPPATTNGQAFMSGFASAVNGTLKSSAAMTYTFNTSPPGTAAGSFVNVVSWAGWTDYGIVGPVAYGQASPTRLNITFGLTGVTAATGSGTTYGGAGGSASGNFVVRSTDVAHDAPAGVYVGSSANDPAFPNHSVNSQYVFSAFLNQDYGTGNFLTSAFTAYLQTSAVANRSPDDPNPSSGQLLSDFSHSVVPLSYTVTDADGNDITAGFNVTFANGLVFAPTAPSTVPEPSSMALLGTGFLGVGCFGRNRRKRANARL